MMTPLVHRVSDVLVEPLQRGARIARYHRSIGPHPILIYTMGKVGSMSLQRSLPAVTGRPTAHFHAMTSSGYRAARRAPGRLPHGYLHGRYFQLRTRLPRPAPWDVVTVVRDPLARIFSAFFQVGERFQLLDAVDGNDIASLSSRFARFYDQYGTSDWFETEFEAGTGIDVYAHARPLDGCSVIGSRRFRVLLLRAEELPRVGPVALQGFFDTPAPVEISRTNAATDKDYAELYARLRASIVVPDDILDDAYGSRFAGHMYTSAELGAFRSNWRRDEVMG